MGGLRAALFVWLAFFARKYSEKDSAHGILAA
jgi:hypothetical protein